jgi:hypothetical protein
MVVSSAYLHLSRAKGAKSAMVAVMIALAFLALTAPFRRADSSKPLGHQHEYRALFNFCQYFTLHDASFSVMIVFDV